MAKNDLPALDPEDYYINEQGLMVFTASYHLKRGYCCKSGCKHCPYGFRQKPAAGEQPDNKKAG